MRNLLMGKQGNNDHCLLPILSSRSVKVNLVYKEHNEHRPTIIVKVKIHYNQQGGAKDEGKFYSVQGRQKTPIGTCHTFLHTKAKGYYVGTILQSQGPRPSMILFFEGDDSTYVDGKMHLRRTDSEDYFNGGWYALLDRWSRDVDLPIHGSLDYSLPMARTGRYRFHISDKVSSEKEIYRDMEHGGQSNDFSVDYISVAMFYTDRPFTTKQEPQGELLKIYKPTTHIYFPQLFEMTIGGDINISSDHGVVTTTSNQGETRIMLPYVPDGKHKVLVDCTTFPDGVDSQVWQRQEQLSDWVSAKTAECEEKNRLYMGDIDLTQQISSITFCVKKNGGANKFGLRLITLK